MILRLAGRKNEPVTGRLADEFCRYAGLLVEQGGAEMAVHYLQQVPETGDPVFF